MIPCHPQYEGSGPSKRKFQRVPYPHVRVDGESKSVTAFFIRYTNYGSAWKVGLWI
jgi:hypothetical protein